MAEGEQQTEVHQTEHVDAEERDRNRLRDRCTLSGYLQAAMAGRAPAGELAEYQAAYQCEPNQIPLALFEGDRPVEQHADATTPAPSSDTGVNVGRVVPYIFDQSIAVRRLGIRTPTVPSGSYSEMAITTPPAAAAKAKGAAIESTAAALTPVSTTPRRISARLSLTAEDIAQVGTARFESGLREALSGSLRRVRQECL